MNFPIAPEQGSKYAQEYDVIYYALVVLTILFTALVAGLVVFFAVRYRHGNKVDRSHPPHEHMKLEMTLLVVPLVLGLIMFYVGAKSFIAQRIPPKDSMDIYVVGKQWMWHLQHSNGVREMNTLHVPVGRTVRLTMISQDVIHAFYVPEFRMQFHVVPGRYTQQWFTASKTGVYHLFCGMYCGTQHSEMGGYVYVMEPGDFAKWLAAGGNDTQPMTMEQRGAKVYQDKVCSNCHTATDTVHGPSLYGLFGKTRKFTDGTTLVADEAYVRESILRPYDHITQGYWKTMPEYDGQVSEEEVLSLIAYLRSMGSPQTAKGIAADEPAKGMQTSGDNYKGEPRLSGGALEGEKVSRPGPKPGNMSVGALSAEGKGKRQ